MEKVVIGRVRKTHGVKGHFKVISFSGEYKHFLGLKSITIRLKGRDKDYQVEEVKPFSSEVLMKLVGIDSPEVARSLATGEILVTQDLAAPLKKGEVYQTDLIGCRLYHEGKEMGIVSSVFDGAQSDLLEVKSGEDTFMIPYMKNYIGEVDTKAGKIELLASWLME
ncbi:MAG: 16S rRNA processing protein RimM [Spirochaetales bacterium]|nr:16S rRNA processing protein RimM [Spirochaetales bacterium]